MQISFEDVYNKMEKELSKNIYYSDINDILNDYEIISTNNIIIDEEFIDMDILEESKLNNLTFVTFKNSLNRISDNFIFFDVTKYIEKILDSYNLNIEKINGQFNLDLPRSELTFNNIRLNKTKQVINLLKKYSKYEYALCNQKFTLDIIIQMLCTQASFAFSFLLMNKVYSNYNEGIHVTSNNTKYIITNDNELININLTAIYNLKDITKNVSIKQININTNVDFIYKNKSYELCKYGIISWNCQDL